MLKFNVEKFKSDVPNKNVTKYMRENNMPRSSFYRTLKEGKITFEMAAKHNLLKYTDINQYSEGME